MSRPFLKTTTAITLSLSLLQPIGGFAQTSTDGPLLCVDGTRQPCAAGVDAVDPADAQAMKKARKARKDAAAATEEPAVEPVPDTEPTVEPETEASKKRKAKQAAAAEAAAAEAAAAEAAAAEKAATEAAAEAADAEAKAAAKAAKAAAAAEAEAADKAAADAEAAAKAEAEAADKAAVEAEAAAKAEAEAVAAEKAAAAETATEDAAGKDTPVASDGTVAEPAVEDPDTKVVVGSDGPETDPATEETDPATGKKRKKPRKGTIADGGEVPSGETTAEDLTDEPEPTPEEALPPVDEPLPEALADVEEKDGKVRRKRDREVETTVTDEDVRTSDEEFDTDVKADSKSGGGLTDLEKVGLVVLGAVIVGAIINNNRVVSNSGDRVVVQRDDGQYVVLKDDDALMREPGATVRTQTYDDGSTLTTITRADGTQIVTIRDAEGRVLRRALVNRDGTQTVLIDDTRPATQVDVTTLPRNDNPVVISDTADRLALLAALDGSKIDGLDRSFSLRQVRDIREVRELAPEIDLESVVFSSGSAAVQPDQASKLQELGTALAELVAANPGEVFLIEGHTDAVGSASSNLALSDRRAESVALVLTEYFGVPPENLVVQGYGEAYLKVRTLLPEQENRRVSVRRITDLLQTASN